MPEDSPEPAGPTTPAITRREAVRTALLAGAATALAPALGWGT